MSARVYIFRTYILHPCIERKKITVVHKFFTRVHIGVYIFERIFYIRILGPAKITGSGAKITMKPYTGPG